MRNSPAALGELASNLRGDLTSARERPSGEVVELGDTPLGASALGIMVHNRAVWRLAGRGWALRAHEEP